MGIRVIFHNADKTHVSPIIDLGDDHFTEENIKTALHVLKEDHGDHVRGNPPRAVPYFVEALSYQKPLPEDVAVVSANSISELDGHTGYEYFLVDVDDWKVKFIPQK